jgi:hypothetical protein
VREYSGSALQRVGLDDWDAESRGDALRRHIRRHVGVVELEVAKRMTSLARLFFPGFLVYLPQVFKAAELSAEDRDLLHDLESMRWGAGAHQPNREEKPGLKGAISAGGWFPKTQLPRLNVTPPHLFVTS